VSDYVWFLNFVVSDYSNPIAPEPTTYALEEYNNNLRLTIEKMRK
jgi:hypothetical protein